MWACSGECPAAWSGPAASHAPPVNPEEALCAQAVGRRLSAEAAEGAPARKSALAPECEALVALAEPGDVFAHYTTAMRAAAVSTQIKALEHKMGLKARPSPLRQWRLVGGLPHPSVWSILVSSSSSMHTPAAPSRLCPVPAGVARSRAELCCRATTCTSCSVSRPMGRES